LFTRIGFTSIKSNDIEFTFEGRTGEIDEIFLQENILLVCEYTVGRPSSEHVSKKSILFSKIDKNPSGWITYYAGVNSEFKKIIETSEYAEKQFRIRIIYASSEGVSDEMISAFPYIKFFDGTRVRYFEALSQTIQRSARHEFYKYLALSYAEVGEQIHSPRDSRRSFSGHLLPEAHSSYPTGFKVVSFYADPETLLALSYVLRQDSWRDGEGLYQRILIKSKIAKMRRYLVEVKRVFVNNIIVTLPSTTSLNDPNREGRNVDPSSLEHAAQISVSVPYSANMIGLVDGQHRVFCYYEGKDPLEKRIAPIRKRQNLLVTGLIFPDGWSDSKKREFEAKLFLEINDNQAKAKSALKQSIELILSPFSTVAIAKEIVNRLSVKGPLAGLLQSSFFDPPDMIKTTSIVSYGLRPLVKFDGADSLFSTWSKGDKNLLNDAAIPIADRRVLLEAYVEYCVGCINAFLIAAKIKAGPERWKLAKERSKQFLSPTLINGFFVCIRKLAESGKLSTTEKYEKKLEGLSAFGFSKYRSSGWKAMGDKIFVDFFGS